MGLSPALCRRALSRFQPEPKHPLQSYVSRNIRHSMHTNVGTVPLLTSRLVLSKYFFNPSFNIILTFDTLKLILSYRHIKHTAHKTINCPPSTQFVKLRFPHYQTAWLQTYILSKYCVHHKKKFVHIFSQKRNIPKCWSTYGRPSCFCLP